MPVLTHTVEGRRPKGVIGHISPWNYPLELSVSDSLPAFVAGNAVVNKPDTQTALTALWARELLIEAGLPADLWQIVIGDGPVIGPAVIEHADYVSFTGSTPTGRDVAQRAAARLVGASLELGGKNALLVLADADLDKAAEGAVRACFSSAGQLCVSVERLFVHRSVAAPSWRSSPRGPGRCGWVAVWPTVPTWARWSPPSSSRRSPGTSRRPSRPAPRC